MSSSSAFVPTAEAAYIAGLSDRDMNRVVDERILPEPLVRMNQGRLFARLGAAFARFYFGTEQEFMADFRRKILAEMTERLIRRVDRDTVLALGTLPNDLSWVVGFPHAQVDLAGFIIETLGRVRQVERADALVRTDPEILGGEPVFAGTRVPISTILASLDKVIARDRIITSYPSVTDELIEAARLYTRVHPRRGRPPRRFADCTRTGK